MDMPQDIMGLGYLMDDLTTKGKVTKNNNKKKEAQLIWNNIFKLSFYL